MHLMIDNYDSFTFNVVQALATLGAEVEVVRNDALSVDDIAARRPASLIISPGPGRPADAGVSLAAIRELAGRVPILGVCLGHQCIVEAFGGEVVRAERVMHGKTSRIYNDGRTLFEGLSNPFEATRYHSLIAREESLPAALEVSAFTSEGEIMGVRHRVHPIEGVQFHPESILTREGPALFANFLRLAAAAAAR
ncbi:MAG: anthranilate/aminodeoxychorismate synthase component II [Gemmatimonas sp.]|nr:anthranilate/aminodeoxychorismate synthase component II [Gemmatimonas sp.]